MNGYRSEFPDFPASDWPGFPHPSFRDASWHNDSQPSMASDELGLHVWVDYADPAQRELQGARFGVHETREDGGLIEGTVLETDDWREVCGLVRARVWERMSKVHGDCVWIAPGAGPETGEAFPNGMVVYVSTTLLGSPSTSWLMIP